MAAGRPWRAQQHFQIWVSSRVYISYGNTLNMHQDLAQLVRNITLITLFLHFGPFLKSNCPPNGPCETAQIKMQKKKILAKSNFYPQPHQAPCCEASYPNSQNAPRCSPRDARPPDELVSRGPRREAQTRGGEINS